MRKKILILGGSGFVGSHLIEHLQRLGAQVTVPTRRMVHTRHLWHMPCVTPLVADVTQAATLAELLPGHDAVVNLVAILHGQPAQFERLHVDLPRTLAQVCGQTGVRRLLHVSSLGANIDGPSYYLRTKAAGEAVLQEAAEAGVLDLTIFRPSVIYGSSDQFLNLFAGFQRALPVTFVAGSATRFQPVWVRDVAAGLVAAFEQAQSIDQIYEAVGPEVFSLGELARLSGRWAGVRNGRGKPVINIPGPIASVMAWLLRIVADTPLLSGDALNSLKSDSVASGQWPDLSALGIAAASVQGVGPWELGSFGPASHLEMLRQAARR